MKIIDSEPEPLDNRSDPSINDLISILLQKDPRKRPSYKELVTLPNIAETIQ